MPNGTARDTRASPGDSPSFLSPQGANVHSFDPSASPAEKAAQARKAAAAVAPVDLSAAPSLRKGELGQFTKDGGSSVVSDVGTKGDKIEVTTGAKAAEVESSKEKEKEKEKPASEADRATQIERDEGRVDEDGVKSPPGAMPKKEAEKGKPRESACDLSHCPPVIFRAAWLTCLDP